MLRNGFDLNLPKMAEITVATIVFSTKMNSKMSLIQLSEKVRNYFPFYSVCITENFLDMFSEENIIENDDYPIEINFYNQEERYYHVGLVFWFSTYDPRILTAYPPTKSLRKFEKAFDCRFTMSVKLENEPSPKEDNSNDSNNSLDDSE